MTRAASITYCFGAGLEILERRTKLRPAAGRARFGYSSQAIPDAISDQLVQEFTKRLTDGFNQRNHHLIEGMLGDHLIDHSELLGRMDLRQRMYQVQRAFPDSRYQVIDYLVQGHAVAWRWSITGTHANEIMGIRPTGRKVTIPGLSVAVILNGKVVEHYEFADLQQVLAQIKYEEPWS